MTVPQELDDFIRSCQKDRFRLAQVDYPRTLSARIGQATTYGAAVDIRDTPAPPGREIDSDDPASDPVYVQCVVGAKLEPLDRGIDVVPVVPGVKPDDDGFTYLTFTPEGVLEWSWSVTPRAPVSQQLRLELKPAAKIDERYERNRTTTAVYVTTVNVTATRIDRLAYWFETQWEPLTAVAGSIGGAILAILAFSSKARDAAKGLFTKQPPKRQTPKAATTASTSTKRPRTKTKQTDKPSTKTKQTDKRSQRTGGGEN